MHQSEEMTRSGSNDASDAQIAEQGDGLTRGSHNEESTFAGISDLTSDGDSEFHIPDVDASLKVTLNSVYKSLEDVFVAYKKYAAAAGFDARKATQTKDKKGRITNKYFLCSKEGVKKKPSFDSLEGVSSKHKRRRADFRMGCPAGIKVHFVEGVGYKVYHSDERHNHCLVSEDDDYLQRSKRGIGYSHQFFTMKASNANLGPVNSFNLLKELSGGFDSIGATKVDFKNLSRDIRSFIGDKDAQMIVDKFNHKMEMDPEFSFHFVTNEEGKLTTCFWVDKTCKLNYDAFGDVVSFDATFKTNKYNMVFVPFTGIDNHQKCVIFAIGLADKETIENYSWLLKAFFTTYSREPYLVLTDQDPAIKQVLTSVLKTAHHRLCMWHIMNKLPSKVGSEIAEERGLRKRLTDLVWNESLDPLAFEERWASLLKEYKLEAHKWLKDMFGIRERWIPAYFRSIPMSGLMKTTSRSESENYFFGQNSNCFSTLVHFFSRFEAAIDKQRYNQRVLDHDTRTTKPSLATPLKIEKHASEVYTREVFSNVQEEIKASLYSCTALSKEIIYDQDENTKGEYKVVFDHSKNLISCSCLHFERFGVLCRHAFYVLRHNSVEQIPEGYILRRWRREAVKLPSFKQACNAMTEAEEMLTKIYSKFGRVINRVGFKMEVLADFSAKLDDIYNDYDAKLLGQNSKSRKENLESLMGTKEPEEVLVQVPENARNKGCGTSKRFKSAREVSMSSQKRLCRACGERSNHDSRNCPKRKED